MTSEFTPRLHKKQAYTFGVSRSAYKNVIARMSPGCGGAVPGPGTYQIRRIVGNGARWTMRFKPGLELCRITRVAAHDGAREGVAPGPGAYSPESSLSTDGKHFCSRFPGSKSTALRSLAKRFSEGGFRLPGPGQYESPPLLSSHGRNLISRFKSSATLSFGHAKRKSLVDDTSLRMLQR